MSVDSQSEAPPFGLVRPFSALGRGSLRLAGGKAMNLGELTRAGFPVPPGFCVTTEAYARAAEGSAVGGVIAELAGVPAGDVERTRALAARAREAILGAPIPEEVAQEVRAAYSALGEGAAVAVRSSATAEDLPGASFAGQQDTFLNVVGEAEVLLAVRRCWASLWTDRAVTYRANNRIDHKAVELAVVVQRMVQSAVAGVLFTANPITGRRRRALIDASPGLGEAVVSGAVNPDHFEVDTTSGEILSRSLGDKKVVIEATAGGGTRHVTREDGSRDPCVTDAELRAIAQLGARVEAHYGAPQDIEWALDADGELLLLQARPITTLHPLPEGAAADDLRVYFNVNVAQGVFRPISPMGVQCWRMFASGTAATYGSPVKEPIKGPSAVKEAGHWVLLDVTGLLKSPLGRRAAKFALKRMEARSAAVVTRLLEEEPRLAEDPKRAPRDAWMVLRALARNRIPLTMARALASPEEARARCVRVMQENLARGEVPAGARPEEKLAAAERMLFATSGRVFTTIAPTFAVGMLVFLLAKRLLAGLSTDVENESVLRSLPHNPTTEMDLELWELAERLRPHEDARRLFKELSPAELSARYLQGDLPAELTEPLRSFLARYGHRGVAEIDAGVARWGENPAHILGAIANYMELPEGAASPVAQFRKGAEEADSMVEELARRAGEKGKLRGAAVRFGLSRVRALAGVRELPKFHFVKVLARVRGLLSEIADDLVAAGRLDARDDVFMLRWGEVHRAIKGEDVRAIARERRATYAMEVGRRGLPRILLSDGTEPEALAGGDLINREGDLRGTPASAGRVTARARVILDPVGARLDPGEILVAPSTDPGWTPLFLTAAGLVMEMGGAMSHGSVVARECGIPAVVGVPRATERIKTGDRVTIDGASGTIEILREVEGELEGESEEVAARA